MWTMTDVNRKDIQLYVVTDCGGLDEARYRVMANGLFFGHHLDWSFTETESMNTLHAGFVGATHVLGEIMHRGSLREGELVGMLLNAAPRLDKDLRGKGRRPEGEEIYALHLYNGVWVVGPNAGLNFYFLRDQIEQSFLVIDTSGLKTPFRSNYVMLPALAEILLPGSNPLIHLEPKELPKVHAALGLFVGAVDNHGNIYVASTLSDDSWIPPMGEWKTLRFGDRPEKFRLCHVDDIFAGRTDDLTLTTGSLHLPNGKPVYYIVKVGGHAYPLLGSPPVGTEIHIEE